MAKVWRFPASLKDRDVHGFFDDFDNGLIEGQSSAGTATDIGTVPWSETGDAGGETLVLDAAGGQITLNTDADDNDEWYFYRTRETFLFANDKPLWWECRLKFSQAATNAANVMVGVMDGVGANDLQDNGGGPAASYSGMLIFVEDGQTAWSFETSDSTTQTTTRSSSTAASSSFITLAAQFQPDTSTTAICTPFIDTSGGSDFVQMSDTTNNVNNDISHTLTFSNATQLSFVIGVKAGSGNAELVTVDYAACYQLR